MELPHYFVASRRSQSSAAQGTAAATGEPLVHAIDSFVLEAAHTRGVEVVVGITEHGALDFALGSELRQRLTPKALEALHFHEVTPPAQRRTLRAEALYLFDMQLVEQTASSPELNDPVYLYGTLVGPVFGSAQPRAIEGQLTMTRADLLHGFVTARDWGFRYQSRASASPHCLHALLPAAREEELATGRGVVLAYPLLAAELAEDDMDNESLVRLILADTIRSLRVDLEQSERDRSWLSRALGGGAAKQLALADDAGLDACFEVVARALALIAGWPSRRAQALKRVLSPLKSATAPGAAVLHPPRAPAQVAPRVVPARPATARTPAPPPAPTKAAGPPEWMQDFMSQHAPGGHHVSVATARTGPRPVRAEPKAATKSAEPEWLADFEEGATPESVQKPPPSDRKEWLNDFEDE